jgi:hypothetical protein
MSSHQPLTPFVESYRFWDVVTLWARERLEHEEIVARALARAVVCDGLKLQSVDARWLKGNDRGIEFKGYPYVGFCATPGSPMCVLRAEALEHLLAIVRKADTPLRDRLVEEFIVRDDFRAWAKAHDLRLPAFWLGTPSANVK